MYAIIAFTKLNRLHGMNRIDFNNITLYAKAMVAVVILSSSVCSEAAEFEGVKFADSLLVGDTQFILKGLGLLRYKIIFKGYVGGLYLPSDIARNEVLDDVPKRLELHYFWDIPAEKFGEAAAPYIRDNVSPKILPKIKKRVERINSLYRDVRKGDRYSLTYYPQNGVELALNGEVLGLIEGADFAEAYFSIWLGKYPLNSKFKQQLLSE